MVTLDALNRALRHVHLELDAVGLLRGRLDAIDVVITAWPAGWWNTFGFVYDRGVGTLAALAGFREGAIYVPWNSPISRRRGETLRDVLRHEYAHALAWLEPSFVRGSWFQETFGGRYDEDWVVRPGFDEDAYVSVYATTSAAEDFAETFCVALRDVSSQRDGRHGSKLEAKVARITDAVSGLRGRSHAFRREQR